MAGGAKGGSVQVKGKGDIISLPVAASTKIFRGTMVAINSTGGLVQAGPTVGLVFAGIAEETVDNNSGALNALQCKVRRKGIFRMYKTAVNAATDVGKVFYAAVAHTASVDEEVELGSAATAVTHVPVGICTAVEATIGTSHYVWIEIAPTALNAAGPLGSGAFITKTATATLTNAEVLSNPIINANHATVAIALTLPPAAAGNAGARAIIGMGGAAAVTVVCAAGFGGVGSGGDILTLAQGDAALVASDGTNWYNVHSTVAA